MSVNQNNFIRWENLSVALPIAAPPACVCDTEKLPSPTQQIKKYQYRPVLVPTEVTNVYINFDTPSVLATFSDWRIDILDSTFAVASSNVATLNSDVLATGFNVWFDLTTPALNTGIYYFLIYDNNTSTSIFISNQIYILDADRASDTTTRLKYRNSYSFYDFGYDNLPAFYNTIRVNIAEDKETSPYAANITAYTAANSGIPRNTRSAPQKSKGLIAYKFDEPAQDAIFCALLHDDLTINDKQYVYDSGNGFEREATNLSPLSDARFSVLDVSYSQINKGCSVLDAVTFISSWNLIDGNFGENVTIAITSLQIAKWVLPDANIIDINILDTPLGGFDGTEKAVSFSLIDEATVFTLELIKPSSALNLSSILFNSANVKIKEDAANFGNGYGFDEIIFKDLSTLGVVDIAYQQVQALNMPNIPAGTGVKIENNGSLTAINWTGLNATSGLFVFRGNDFLSLDLSSFTVTAANMQISGNTSLSSFIPATGTVSIFKMLDSLLTNIDINGIASTGTIDISANTAMNTITLGTAAHTPINILLDGNALQTLNLGGASLGPATTLVDLRNNGATQAEVDAWYVSLDANAVGGSTGSILAGGNATPTGGLANANVVSLIAKGFSVSI